MYMKIKLNLQADETFPDYAVFTFFIQISCISVMQHISKMTLVTHQSYVLSMKKQVT